jgi:hypothetical protein
VLEIRLSRRGRDDFEGPILELRVHLFRGRRDPETASGVSWHDHTQATMRFSNVVELDLGEFNHQNAILDLRFEDAGAHPLAPGLRAHRVTLEPAFGVRGSFVCGAIEVSEIERGAPPGSVYADD